MLCSCLRSLTVFCLLIAEASYQTIEQVAAALKRRDVKAALVDVASAAAHPELFKHPDIDAAAVIEHPFSYGFVLAGEMSNAANTLRDFIKVEQQETLKTLEKSTAGFKVRARRFTFQIEYHAKQGAAPIDFIQHYFRQHRIHI